MTTSKGLMRSIGRLAGKSFAVALIAGAVLAWPTRRRDADGQA